MHCTLPNLNSLAAASLVFLSTTAVTYAGIPQPGRPEPADLHGSSADMPTVAQERPPTVPWIPGPGQTPDGARSPGATVSRGQYVSVQVNVDAHGWNIVGDAANEPSIAVNPRDPSNIVIGWRQFDTVDSDFRQAGWAYSNDGGATWTFPGVIEPRVFRSDPVLDADGDGNFYFHSLTVRDGLYYCHVFKSTDGGTSWHDGVYAFGGDKAWMAIDRTGGLGHGNLYAAWDFAGCCGQNWFNRSTDGAQTFDAPIPIPLSPMWGVTAVGPDGEVYVAGRSRTSNATIIVAKSSTVKDPTGPLAFDFAEVVDLGGRHQYFLGYGPNPGGLIGQVWVAADHSNGPTRGSVYVLCSVDPPGPDPADVMFSRSTNGGLDWSVPVRVNDDPIDNGAWQWFGTMSVAPNGRIDAVWNDTRSTFDADYSELYYAFSSDGGRTWSEGVAVSPAFNSLDGWPMQNKLGDYYDMVSDNSGADVAYAATFNGEQDVYHLRIPTEACCELSVRPGRCPNSLVLSPYGIVQMAVVGTESFDVADIDKGTLMLTRAGDFADGITPLGAVVWDVATPSKGNPCDCHDVQGDGIDDLAIWFRMDEVTRLIEAGGKRRIPSITLTVSGSLGDGGYFEASDCVPTIEHRRAYRGRIRVGGGD